MSENRTFEPLPAALTQRSGQDLSRIIVIAAFFVFTIIFFAPAQIYFGNIEELPLQYDELFASLFVRFCPSLVVVIICLVVIPRQARRKTCAMLLALALLLWLQGNVLVWDYGALNGEQIAWDKYLLNGLAEAAIWIICSVFAWIYSENLFAISLKLGLMFIITELLSLGAMAVHNPAEHVRTYTIDENRKFVFSQRNVIILVLDAFQSDLFQELNDEATEYSASFAGFTYYRNALSGFPCTDPSVAMILTGQQYDNSVPILKFLRHAFSSGLSLPRVLAENAFRVELYPHNALAVYGTQSLAENVVDKRLPAEKQQNLVRNLHYVAIFRYSPHFVKQMMHEGLWLERLLSSIGGAKKNIFDLHRLDRQLEFVEQMERAAMIGEDRPTFKYYHVDGLHRPFRLNRHLQHLRLPDNRAGAKEEARAVLALTQRFLLVLKKLGVFNQSMVLIIGDHGLGLPVRTPADLAELATPSKGQVSSRIRGLGLPLILIKPFDSSEGLRISDDPISLGDLPKIVADALLLGKTAAAQAEHKDGPVYKTRRFLFYKWRPGLLLKGFNPPMREYEVTGHSWLTNSWRAKGVIR